MESGKGGSVPPVPATFNTTGIIGQSNELRPSPLPAQPGSAPPNIFGPEQFTMMTTPTTTTSVPIKQSINSSVTTSGCSADLNDALTTLDIDSELVGERGLKF